MSRDESPLVRAVSPDEGYTYVHRAFLHAFLTHNVLTADEIKPILAAVMTAHNPERPWTTGDVTAPQITNTIQMVNAKISHYDFEIRSTKDQQNKLTVYALVNKTSDALTQFATKFSAGEIAYVRRLLDYIFDTNNTHTREVMAIKHNDASNLARIRRSRQSQATLDADESQSADPGISIAEADDVLATLLQQSFFQKSPAQYYSLAPRALMELRAYLKETYNDLPDDVADGETPVIRIKDCEGCREIVTHGIRCNNRDCGVRWHDACANSYYRGRGRDNRKCPKCETECTGDVYVGERADRIVGRSSTGGGRRRQEEEDEEE
ncbi:Nse1 non-SMC component of SMC5-6 complex-domain-containing protein [Paraphoma chrysanthemicola]|nr:Nse1 non-SMC component of SMC5-6 complex-domain-containing protein [Paraphoma chrysanthemicola]